MAENKMIKKMAKLMQMSNAVTYEPNALQIELSAQPAREKYYVTADDGHLTIDYTSLGKLLYNAGYRKQEWISVDERLPEEDGRYLVCVDIEHSAFEFLTTMVTMEYSINHGFYTYKGKETLTHWMPLPEPPETKGETE